MKTNVDYWKGKNVLITGGSSGLGKAMAILLEGRGARVCVVARRVGPIDALIGEYPNIVGIQGDVSDKEAILAIAGEAHARLGDVDVLVNAASYLGPTPLRLLIDTECEAFEEVLQTNLLGPFRLTKALLPAMLLNGSGLVINISSDAAVQAYARWGAYSVSKAGLDHLSRVFEAELAERGIRFWSVDPTDMSTPMHFAAVPDANPDDLCKPEVAACRIVDLVSQQDFEKVRCAS